MRRSIRIILNLAALTAGTATMLVIWRIFADQGEPDSSTNSPIFNTSGASESALHESRSVSPVPASPNGENSRINPPSKWSTAFRLGYQAWLAPYVMSLAFSTAIGWALIGFYHDRYSSTSQPWSMPVRPPLKHRRRTFGRALRDWMSLQWLREQKLTYGLRKNL